MVKTQESDRGHDTERSVRRGSGPAWKTGAKTSHGGHFDTGGLRDDVWSAKSVRDQPVGTRPRPGDVAVSGIQSRSDAERSDPSQGVQKIGQVRVREDIGRVDETKRAE